MKLKECLSLKTIGQYNKIEVYPKGKGSMYVCNINRLDAVLKKYGNCEVINKGSHKATNSVWFSVEV